MPAYEKALQELYQAPLSDFLTERKRLSSELRASKEAAAASEIAKRRKPTASVWAVNQLYWHARAAFDEMLAAARRVRNRNLEATREYHDAISKLRKDAAELLEEAGLGASDATLRRVASTLSAIAATGGFDPDPPGALSEDRDPPGFEAVGIPSSESATGRASRHDGVASREPSSKRPAHEQGRREAEDRGRPDTRAQRELERERQRRERADQKAQREEKKRQAAERSRRKVEQKRMEMKLHAATKKLRERERERSALETRLRETEKAVGAAREKVEDLERALRELAADEGQ